MDENDEVAQTENEQTETVVTEAATEVEEDSFDWKAEAERNKAEAEKNKTAFEDQKKRAEKAEGKLKEQPKPKSGDDLSSKDILALSTSGISDEEDIELLQKAAKLNGTSIAAALKDPVVASLLKGKQEERQTAIASSTSPTRRTSTERKGSDLLASAKADNMPAPGKDMRKMVRASLGLGD